MKSYLYKFIVAALVLVAGVSCSSYNNTTSNAIKAEATIKDYGNPLADGCDWVVIADGVTYHPDTLSTEFKQGDLKVTIEYQLAGKDYTCGMNSTKMPVINISSIKKK